MIYILNITLYRQEHLPAKILQNWDILIFRGIKRQKLGQSQ